MCTDFLTVPARGKMIELCFKISVYSCNAQYVLSSHELFIFRQVDLCVKILSDIMELLFRSDIGSTGQDVKEIMLTVLRTVIQTTIAMDRERPLVVSL
jgi:hypothetical protein